MGLNGQPNMFFGKIIFYTCDLDQKLYILNPLNIMFCQMVKKIESFALQPCVSKF